MFSAQEQEDGTWWVVDRYGVPIATGFYFYSEACEHADELNGEIE